MSSILGTSNFAAFTLLFAVAVVALALGLQGCGGGGHGNGWNLAPIEVRGSHMYDSKSGKEFHAKGIAFPNVGKTADVTEWIAVLQRVKKLSKQINAIRIYEPPNCAVEFGSTCFEPFMKEADRLGVYVLVPGSGTEWGYFPGVPEACKPPILQGLQGCYEVGGILGWGRTIVDNFHYPNTLAIILANEIEQNIQALPVLKAYARDLKMYMSMCNSESDSPTNGQMRQIPLMYAATDEGLATWDEADYLFCGDQAASIDIFGVNNERWISDAGGRTQYDETNKIVMARQWPGAYMHSEEGGPYGAPYPAVPTWNQLPGFFNNWHAIDGFFAYAYYGNKQYNMFDGTSASAQELPDGKQFFPKVDQVGAKLPNDQPVAVKTPVCKTSVTLKNGQSYTLLDYTTAKSYETGKNTWAPNCPRPVPPMSAMQNADALTVTV